jgi:hypothetical protein
MKYGGSQIRYIKEWKEDFHSFSMGDKVQNKQAQSTNLASPLTNPSKYI